MKQELILKEVQIFVHHEFLSFLLFSKYLLNILNLHRKEEGASKFVKNINKVFPLQVGLGGLACLNICASDRYVTATVYRKPSRGWSMRIRSLDDPIATE